MAATALTTPCCRAANPGLPGVLPAGPGPSAPSTLLVGGVTVGDAMVRSPKVFPADVTVAQVRQLLADDHIHMALIAEEARLLGTVTVDDLDPSADPGALALTVAATVGRTVRPATPLQEARLRMVESAQRRLAVVDADDRLVGLLCLKRTGRGFCSDRDVAARAAVSTAGRSNSVEQAQERATEAMMAVSRTMTAIVARTLTEVAEEITVPQLRVLVLLSSRGPMNLRTIADHLDVNPSNASRTCEQLVVSGKVSRDEDQDDRRNVTLQLTSKGAAFVERLMDSRRRLIDGVIARMDPSTHDDLALALEAFSDAVASAPAEESIGLPDGRIIPWLM